MDFQLFVANNGVYASDSAFPPVESPDIGFQGEAEDSEIHNLCQYQTLPLLAVVGPMLIYFLLGQVMIKSFGRYELLSNNCQDFAIALFLQICDQLCNKERTFYQLSRISILTTPLLQSKTEDFWGSDEQLQKVLYKNVKNRNGQVVYTGTISTGYPVRAGPDEPTCRGYCVGDTTVWVDIAIEIPDAVRSIKGGNRWP